ncbi:hypothetical protein N7540_003384 [Penicillium herquei]|nr:hypothetical protein N7540_003384 [Penicillium herquei]
MINFFYTSNYKSPMKQDDCIMVDAEFDDEDKASAKDVLLYRQNMKSSTVFAQPLFHASLYALADRLLIPALKELAIWKLRSLIFPENVFPPFLIDMIRSIYTSTPPFDRGMRDIIIDTVSDRMDRLRTSRHAILEPVFFDEVPQFARDLLVMVMNKLPPAVTTEYNTPLVRRRPPPNFFIPREYLAPGSRTRRVVPPPNPRGL